jgi:hypothetical protein
MLKGDATCSTRKAVLGWIVDTLKLTVELPNHCFVRLFEILVWVRPPQRRIITNKRHQLLEELSSMVISIPGGRGLFSLLQQALKHRREQGSRVRLSSGVHAFFADIR